MSDVATASRALSDLGLTAIDELEDPVRVFALLVREEANLANDPAALILRARCRVALGQAWTAVLEDVRRAASLPAPFRPDRDLAQLYRAFLEAMAGSNPDAARATIHRVIASIDDWSDDPNLHELGNRMFAKALSMDAELVAGEGTVAALTSARRACALAIRTAERGGWDSDARDYRISLAISVLNPLGLHLETVEQLSRVLAAPNLTPSQLAETYIMRGFAAALTGDVVAAQADFHSAEALSRSPLAPGRLGQIAWGRATMAAASGDLAATALHARRAETTALAPFDGVAAPFLADMVLSFGELRDYDLAEHYLQRATGHDNLYGRYLSSIADLHALRRGRYPLSQIGELVERSEPSLWERIYLHAALNYARKGALEQAHAYQAKADAEMTRKGFTVPTIEAKARAELTDLLAGESVAKQPLNGNSLPVTELRVLGVTTTLWRGSQRVPLGGRGLELLALVAANGGRIGSRQAAIELSPDAAIDDAKRRLDNISSRLRRQTGIEIRGGGYCTLPVTVVVDLLDLDDNLNQAEALRRGDPDAAERFAFEAITSIRTGLLADFSAPWAVEARDERRRRAAELAKFLQIRATDLGNPDLRRHWTDAEAQLLAG